MPECEVVPLPSAQDDDDAEADDPLNDEMYFRAHRRFERQEKQLRNIERERAQHEKLQLDRILDELRGRDWLRVMGISGIPDGKKKLYEPKREFFTRELTALSDKFKAWREEEKRRKLEKEKMLSQAEEEEESPEDELDSADQDSDALFNTTSRRESTDVSDVDTWAARQLHLEARTASAGKRPPARSHPGKDSTKQETQKREPPLPPPPSLPPLLPEIPTKPFTSFFATRSLRDEAMNRQQGKGHTTNLAFGHPVPEMVEREFEPPREFLTPEYIQACQRQRRRMKRERKREN